MFLTEPITMQRDIAEVNRPRATIPSDKDILLFNMIVANVEPRATVIIKSNMFILDNVRLPDMRKKNIRKK